MRSASDTVSFGSASLLDLNAFVAAVDARAARRHPVLLGTTIGRRSTRRRAPRPVNVPAPAPRPPGVPDLDLRDWDLIVVNTSGGKDSQCAMQVICRQAAAQGVLDRVVVNYCDLGERVVWPGTADIGPNAPLLVAEYGDRPGCRDLAGLHARVNGVPADRFRVTRYDGGDLLDAIAERGMFPDKKNRWCTSSRKRDVSLPLLTDLVRQVRRAGLRRRARILYVFGFRAAESDDRAAKVPFGINDRASNKTRREVWDLYPIHHWTDAQVWADIRRSGVPFAWPYDAGMSRLSCSYCVLGSTMDLMLASVLRPDVAAQYIAVEQRIGHTFQNGRSLESIAAAATAAGITI